MSSRRRRLARRRWTRALGLVALAIAYLGWNAFAWFSGTASNSVALEAGNLSVTLGASGPDNRLSIAATHLVPGDIVMRAVTLTVDGSVDAESVSLTTEATTSSLLDTTPDMLSLIVAKCSVPFDEAMQGGFPAYDCSGTSTYLANNEPAIVEDYPLTGLDLTPGATNYLVVAFVFGEGDNNLQGQHSVIELSFEAQQRAGEYK